MKRIAAAMVFLCCLCWIPDTNKAKVQLIDKVEAPVDLVYTKEEWNEHSALKAVYALGDDIAQLMSDSKEELLKKYDCDEVIPYIIFDWSIDSDKAWHYDITWDNEETILAPLYAKAEKGLLNTGEVFWFTYKEQLEYFSACIKSSEESNIFDYSDHTLFLRAKFVVEFRKERTYQKRIESTWSQVQMIDEAYELSLDPDLVVGCTLAKGQLCMNDTEGISYVSFFVEYPSELKKTMLALSALCDAEFQIEAQIRINGGEWKDTSIVDSTIPYDYGERKILLNEKLPSGQNGIQVRIRYYFEGNEERKIAAFTTPWSNCLTIGTNYWIESNEDRKTKKSEYEREEQQAYQWSMLGLLGVLTLIGVVLLIKKPKDESKGES